MLNGSYKDMSRPHSIARICLVLIPLHHSWYAISVAFCVEIRKMVESTFEKVCSRMNYRCFIDYQLSLNVSPTLGESTCVLLKEVSLHLN